MTPAEIKALLQLEPHPEGGFFKEFYRASGVLPKDALPQAYSGNRNVATAIWFLLDKGDKSMFHRLISDEIWHLHGGGPVHIHIIDPRGQYILKVLSSYSGTAMPVALIPGGCWFAAAPAALDGFGLMACTVSPGFHFDDFELARRDTLTEHFPQHSELIREFTTD